MDPHCSAQAPPQVALVRGIVFLRFAAGLIAQPKSTRSPRELLGWVGWVGSVGWLVGCKHIHATT